MEVVRRERKWKKLVRWEGKLREKISYEFFVEFLWND
jgi:hypothetical protein